MLCRCTSALEDPEAFRPQTGLAVAPAAAAANALTLSVPGSGTRSRRPVVQAALFAHQVVATVMGWVNAVPLFATSSLTGGQAVLLPVLWQALYISVCAPCICYWNGLQSNGGD